MIFTTVGDQMSFDRLVKTVDTWAQRSGRTDVFAQIGPTRWRPSHISWAQFLEPEEYIAKARAARVIIAHAGMGTILTALSIRKPILVMPRRGDLRETRNDHQIATALRLRELGLVATALNEQELPAWLDRIDTLEVARPVQARTSDQLLRTIREFVVAGAPRR